GGVCAGGCAGAGACDSCAPGSVHPYVVAMKTARVTASQRRMPDPPRRESYNGSRAAGECVEGNWSTGALAACDAAPGGTEGGNRDGTLTRRPVGRVPARDELHGSSPDPGLEPGGGDHAGGPAREVGERPARRGARKPQPPEPGHQAEDLRD